MRRSRLGRLGELRHSRAHFGGIVAIALSLGRRLPPLRRPLGALEAWMGRYSDRRARRFDRRYGTDTFERVVLGDLEVRGSLDEEMRSVWRYGPINEDFFREIVESLPIARRDYAFLDVGSGKGLAILLASEYGFRRLVGVEFAPELVDVAKKNQVLYAAAVRRDVRVDWVCSDILKVDLPDEPTLFFLNNPFPAPMAVHAVRHILDSLRAHPRRAVVVYRRPPREALALLEEELRPLRSTPYWWAFESVS